MKGKGLIFFAGFAILAGAVATVYLSQKITEKEAVIAGALMSPIQVSKANATITEQGDTLTQKEKEIKELKTGEATLETTQA